MGQQWYYIARGKRGGPVSAANLKQMAAGGQLLPTDMVWTEKMAAWAPAASLKGLFRAGAVPPPPPPPVPLAPAPVVAPPPEPSVRHAARHAFRGFQDERLAQWWGFWIGVVAAGAAAYFSWHWASNPTITIGAAVVAFCVGGWIGYKCAWLLTVLLGLAILVAGVLIFINYQQENKPQEDGVKNAVFDPHSLDTTLHWMTVQGSKVTEADAKQNEVLSKEALEALSRTLATAEGNPVQWQATVASVGPAAVTVQSPSLGSGYALTFQLVALRRVTSDPEQRPGLVLPISPEQSRNLIAGQMISFTGRVSACRVERASGTSGNNLAFTLVVSEARVVD
jgi:hypothetical protein